MTPKPTARKIKKKFGCDICFLADIKCRHRKIKKYKMKGLKDFL